MKKAKLSEPRMLRHPRTGRAFIFVYDREGKRKQVWLGAAFGSPEAQRHYHRELALWHASLRDEAVEAMARQVPDRGLCVGDAVARWLTHCDNYYVGSSESRNCRDAVHHLLKIFGDTPAADFSPKRLKLLRDAMARGIDPDRSKLAGRPRGWSRSTINLAVGRIRRCFKWLASEELVPAAVHASLCTVEPLKRGRGQARETPPTKPVSDHDVDKVLPFLPPVVADMVRLQHLVGMRSIELCAMTTGEVDRSESLALGCWVFRPSKSKLSYKGRNVEYVLGPRAVEIVRQYVRADPTMPLFTPAESEQARRDALRARRRTPVQPSQLSRRVAQPQRAPGDHYTTASYGAAIRRACKHAGISPWGPHSLRRAVATRIRAEYGVEAARVALGHATIEMATLYGHRDLKAAAEIAVKIG